MFESHKTNKCHTNIFTKNMQICILLTLNKTAEAEATWKKKMSLFHKLSSLSFQLWFSFVSSWSKIFYIHFLFYNQLVKFGFLRSPLSLLMISFSPETDTIAAIEYLCLQLGYLANTWVLAEYLSSCHVWISNLLSKNSDTQNGQHKRWSQPQHYGRWCHPVIHTHVRT